MNKQLFNNRKYIVVVIAIGLLIFIIAFTTLLDYTVQFRLLAIFFTGLLVYMLPGLLRSFQLGMRAKIRRVQDVSYENRQPPPQLIPLMEILSQLGFRRLGEIATDLPGHKDTTTWMLIDEKGIINVEAIYTDTAQCQFNTVFDNEGVVETSFPFGRKMDRKNFTSRMSYQSAQDAYKLHVDTISKLYETHGQPRRISDITEIVVWDVRYRELYIDHKKWTVLRTNIFFIIFLIFMVAWSIWESK